MLARSSSSRRRRASRSAALPSPQRSSSAKASTKSSIAAAAAATTGDVLEVEEMAPRSRRASMAVTGCSVPALNSRSPRNSITNPQTTENNHLSVSSTRSRGSISVIDNSDLLHPSKIPSRSRGASFSEHTTDALLSPGMAGTRSARGSFSVPDGDGLLAPGSRSARGSFAAQDGDFLLQPSSGTRSARGSFSSPNSEIQISVSGTRSARASFSVPGDPSLDISLISRSPRESFSMPLDRRRIEGGLLPPEMGSGRSRSGSVAVDASARSPRGSICPELMNKSPRGSISEFNRSPRGSIGPEYNRSPRGSLGPDPGRSPRGSIGPDGLPLRSPRTSPRGSLPDASPRGSLSAIALQESPRNSIDLGRAGSLKGRAGAFRLATRAENGESRRASSSVSQVSADDRRQLCEQSKLNPEAAGAGHTVYGSVVYQLKDANMEASGCCDFTFRALQIVYKTATVTVILVCLSTLPPVMLIMGVNYLRECPKEPNLPVYMIVGGCFGVIRMVWFVWSQVRSRRYDRLDVVAASSCEEGLLPSNIAAKVASAALSLFLLVWFILGNFWTLHIYFPDSEQHSYFEPNQWCSKSLYVFSLVHLAVFHCMLLALLCLTVVLSCCYVFSCPLVIRYR